MVESNFIVNLASSQVQIYEHHGNRLGLGYNHTIHHLQATEDARESSQRVNVTLYKSTNSSDQGEKVTDHPFPAVGKTQRRSRKVE